jgi:hypothetical protein
MAGQFGGALGLVVGLAVVACGGEPDAGETGAVGGGAADTAVQEGLATGGLALRADGIGDIEVGISVVDAMDRAGTAAVDPEPAAECRYVTFPTLPEGVAFMVVRDTIRRVDVDASDVLTERGAGIGMTTARVEELYGGIAQRMPHKYEPDGEYLIIPGTPANTRLVFETALDTVRTMRAGLLPEIMWVERCG